VCACVCVCVCVCVCIHLSMHTYLHTYTHTHKGITQTEKPTMETGNTQTVSIETLDNSCATDFLVAHQSGQTEAPPAANQECQTDEEKQKICHLSVQTDYIPSEEKIVEKEVFVEVYIY
jgi:hypothetical protein